MGIKERKEREKQQRRNDIIDAAEKIFFSKSYNNATMEDVANEAELSIGTLYKYFNNKEDLYLAITQRGMEIMEDLFKTAYESKDKGMDKIFAIGKAYKTFYDDYANYFETLMFFELKDIDMELKDSAAARCDLTGDNSLFLLIEAIRIGAKDGTIRNDIDPVKTAIVLWGNSTGIFQLMKNKGDLIGKKTKNPNIDTNDIIEYAFQMIYEALKPK